MATRSTSPLSTLLTRHGAPVLDKASEDILGQHRDGEPENGLDRIAREWQALSPDDRKAFVARMRKAASAIAPAPTRKRPAARKTAASRAAARPGPLPTLPKKDKPKKDKKAKKALKKEAKKLDKKKDKALKKAKKKEKKAKKKSSKTTVPAVI